MYGVIFILFYRLCWFYNKNNEVDADTIRNY